MDSFTELFKKEHMGELILVILMIIYLILGFKTPDIIANLVDNLIAKIFIILVIIYLFMYSNPILAVVALLAAFVLMHRSGMINMNNRCSTGLCSTGLGALSYYAPSEQKKMSYFTAFNQFPYTLEQEVVSKMAPIVHSGSSLTSASYKPMLDNIYDASPISHSN
jgi:ABC-type multidrug transport system fused ATPase/permease subunit